MGEDKMSFIKYLFEDFMKPLMNIWILIILAVILFGALLDMILHITLFIVLFPLSLFILLSYLDYRGQTNRGSKDDK